MKKFVFSLVLFFCFTTAYAQNDSLDNVIDLDSSRPRSKENFGAPGHYELVASIDKAQINKGDSALVTVFITGYGEIKQSKIFISSSTSEIFDKLIIIHSFGQDESGAFWGSMQHQANTLPAFLQMSGGPTYIKNGETIPYGSYLDMGKMRNQNRITTEETMRNPPIVVKVYFKDSARPDDYKLNMYFTYFNGAEWTGSIATLDFRINSFVQENETTINTIAIIVGIAGLFFAAIGTLPILASIYNFYKKQINKRLKKKRIVKREQPRIR